MSRPTADRLADEAHQCLAQWKGDDAWKALLGGALAHLTRWPTMLGTPVVDRLDLSRDGRPLLEEGARALAIKAAAYILAADDLADMLPVAVPVEEAARALPRRSTSCAISPTAQACASRPARLGRRPRSAWQAEVGGRQEAAQSPRQRDHGFAP